MKRVQQAIDEATRKIRGKNILGSGFDSGDPRRVRRRAYIWRRRDAMLESIEGRKGIAPEGRRSPPTRTADSSSNRRR